MKKLILTSLFLAFLITSQKDNHLFMWNVKTGQIYLGSDGIMLEFPPPRTEPQDPGDYYGDRFYPVEPYKPKKFIPVDPRRK